MHDFPQEITHGDEHIVGHQYDNHNDEFATLLTNDTEVLRMTIITRKPWLIIIWLKWRMMLTNIIMKI